MDRSEFLRTKIDIFLNELIDQYNIEDNVKDKGVVVLWLEKGMYVLPNTSIIVQKLLDTLFLTS